MGFMGTLLYTVPPVNISMYLAETGIGNSTAAGLATTLQMCGAVCGGLLFGKISEQFGHYTFVIGFLAMCFGHSILFFSTSMPMIYLGCIVSGFGLVNIMPRAISEGSEATGNGATVSALCVAASSLGAFCTPIITTIATMLPYGGGVGTRFVCSAVLALCMVLIVSLTAKK